MEKEEEVVVVPVISSPTTATSLVGASFVGGSIRCFAGSDHRLVLKEGALCDYYTICLSSKPTHAVEIIASTPSSNDLEIDPANFTIAPEQWEETFTVKVRAIDHPGSDGFSWSTDIRCKSKSKDPRYQSPRALIVPDSIQVTVMENDAPHMFSFGDSNSGQTGIGHLNLQSTPHYVDFQHAMNVPLDIHETMSDRNSHRIVNTTRPWHSKPKHARPPKERPSKASTSMLLRRILQHDASMTTSSQTASEAIASRRSQSAYRSQQHHVPENDNGSSNCHDASSTDTTTTPSSILSSTNTNNNTETNNNTDNTDNTSTSTSTSRNDDATLSVNCSSAMAETKLLTTLFPQHKNLHDHQLFESQQEQNRYKKKKRVKLSDLHQTKRQDREERKKLYESKFPPPNHISVLSCGSDHSAVVTGCGRLYTWGCGVSGCLGLGSEQTNRRRPHVWNLYDIGLFKHTKVKDVSCGEDHTAIVLNSGLVCTFGSGINGRLGHADNKKRNKPKVVESLRETHVSTVVCGGKFTLLLTSDQTNPIVMSAGHGQTGALGHGDRPTRSARRKDCRTFQVVKLLRDQRPFFLSAGAMHSAVLCGDGRCLTFGFGESGQLGRKLLGGGSSSDVPTKVRFPGKTQHNVRLCICGGRHTLLLDDDNVVWSFGANDAGQLGLGDRHNRHLPHFIKSLIGKSDVVDIAGGLRHSAVVCEDGACYMFGAGQQGQLGVGGERRQSEMGKRRQKRPNKRKESAPEDHLMPMLNARLSELRVVQISCGGSHTLVTTLDNFQAGSKTGEAVHSKIQRRAHAERRAQAAHSDLLKLLGDHGHGKANNNHDLLNNLKPTHLGEKNHKRKKHRHQRNHQPHKVSNIESLKNSNMIKTWLKKRVKRAETNGQKQKQLTEDEIERKKYAALSFPLASDYENLDLRDFCQEIFNHVDKNNDGRVRIDVLSSAIKYNTSLVSMLASREEVAVLSQLHDRGTELKSLDRIDLNHDGWLTVTELLTFAFQHKEEMMVIKAAEKVKAEEISKIANAEEEQRRRQQLMAETHSKRKEVKERRRYPLRPASAGRCRRKDIQHSKGTATRKMSKADKSDKGTTVGKKPLRPASAGHMRSLQGRKERWQKLAKKQRPTTATFRSRRAGTGMHSAPGPYSQYQTLSDRRRAFERLKEMFQMSYQKSLKQRQAHIARPAYFS